MEGVKTSTLVVTGIVLAFIAVALFSILNLQARQKSLAVTNFDECASAGYPIMESFPEQCRTPDGRTFVKEYPTSTVPAGPISFNGCAVAGCSGQLCVRADEADDIFTTCEYRVEYACYREAVCEPQADDTCGWTQTPELALCLASPPPLQ